MAAHVLIDYEVSATATTPVIAVKGSYPTQVWMWEITDSGSGDNTLDVTCDAVANVQQTAASQVLIPVAHSRAFRWPELITTELLDSTQYGGTYKDSFEVPALETAVQFTFAYSGGGSQTFTINLYVEG